MNNQRYLKVATQGAKESGKIFKQYFGNAGKVSTKNGNPRDLVTEIDKKIETQIRKLVLKHFPKHKIIGEEYGSHILEKNDLIWIIDPIDGTNNFIQGLPICCISIALWDKQGPLIAAVYNPILNYMFTGVRGEGAFLNGKKIKISAQTNLSKAFGGYGWGRNVNKGARNFPKLVKILNKIRTLGSTTFELAFVALGVYDFHIQAEIKIWDFAASVLLVSEAGGKVTDWQGKTIGLETTNLLAGNKKLHNQLLAVAKKI